MPLGAPWKERALHRNDEGKPGELSLMFLCLSRNALFLSPAAGGVVIRTG